MARTRTPQTEVAEPTGTVQARRKNERAREREAREASAQLRAETLDAQKATAKRVGAKTENTRDLADPATNYTTLLKP